MTEKFPSYPEKSEDKYEAKEKGAPKKIYRHPVTGEVMTKKEVEEIKKRDWREQK